MEKLIMIKHYKLTYYNFVKQSKAWIICFNEQFFKNIFNYIIIIYAIIFSKL